MKCTDCVAYRPNSFNPAVNPGWCRLNPVPARAGHDHWCMQFTQKCKDYTPTKGRRNLCSKCNRHKELH